MTGNGKVFISHAHEDRARCGPLLDMLRAWGVDYWFDEQRMSAGTQISRAIQEAIRERDIFIRVCTPAAQRSYWVNLELDAFRGIQAAEERAGEHGRRTLVNLIVDAAYAAEPFDYATIYVDAANKPESAWWDDLRRALAPTPDDLSARTSDVPLQDDAPPVAAPATRSLPRLRWLAMAVVAVLAALMLVSGGALLLHARTSLIFQDSLAPAHAGWPQEGDCMPKADGYHVTRSVPPCLAPVDKLGDVAISVKVSQIAGTPDRSYGLVFRSDASATNYYYFVINSGGVWALGKAAQGTFSQIVAPRATPAIHTGIGAVNTLALRTVGSRFSFSINGTVEDDVSDVSYTSGRCGVVGSSGAEVVFNDFTVSPAG